MTQFRRRVSVDHSEPTEGKSDDRIKLSLRTLKACTSGGISPVVLDLNTRWT